MAHFAKLDENNIVTGVYVVGDEYEATYAEWRKEFGEIYVQTSYNAASNGFRKNYAGIGYTFDGTGFAPPQPFASWILNSETYLWEAPTPMPSDGKRYLWNEEELSWDEL